MAPKLYSMVCANQACKELITTPIAKQKYCSTTCARAANGGPATPQGRMRGGLRSSEIRRERALKRLEGLSPVEIFRIGYSQGYNQGMRRKPRGRSEAGA